MLPWKFLNIWVVDVRGKRIFAFRLQENGIYQPCETSKALTGLSIDLLEQALVRLETDSNGRVANWFIGQIQNRS